MDWCDGVINQTLHFLVKACKLVLDLSWNLIENPSLKAPVMTTSQGAICINLPLLHHLKSRAQPAGDLPLMTSYSMWKMSRRHPHVNSSVVGCQNQHESVLSVPASVGQTTRDHWIKLMFICNVAATLPSALHVRVKHFAPECFINFGQYRAKTASTLC